MAEAIVITTLVLPGSAGHSSLLVRMVNPAFGMPTPTWCPRLWTGYRRVTELRTA